MNSIEWLKESVENKIEDGSIKNHEVTMIKREAYREILELINLVDDTVNQNNLKRIDSLEKYNDELIRDNNLLMNTIYDKKSTLFNNLSNEEIEEILSERGWWDNATEEEVLSRLVKSRLFQYDGAVYLIKELR